MSHLRENIDFSFVSGTGDLIQISYSPYQVILKFEKMSIDIESLCEILSPTTQVWKWKPEEVSEMIGFSRLLGTQVISCRVLSDENRLLLTFSNHYQLVLSGYNAGYESFSIETEDKSIIIS